MISVGWDEHPRLRGLSWSERLRLIAAEVDRLQKVAGVLSITEVEPAGCSATGRPGVKRMAQHQGRRHAYWSVFEAMKNLQICRRTGARARELHLDAATLFEAERGLEIFGGTDSNI